MIVAKFGGSSVADAAAIRRLIDIVRSRQSARPVIVVSALAGVTDSLLALAPMVESGKGPAVDAAVLALVSRHAETARELPGAEAALEQIRTDAEALCRELTRSLGRRLSPAGLDALAGRGSSGARSSSPRRSRGRDSMPSGSTRGQSS